jgi:hypothetical protein
MSSLKSLASIAAVGALAALFGPGCAAPSGPEPSQGSLHDDGVSSSTDVERTDDVQQAYINTFWSWCPRSGWGYCYSYSFYLGRWLENYCYSGAPGSLNWKVCFSTVPRSPGSPSGTLPTNHPMTTISKPPPAGAPTAAP